MKQNSLEAYLEIAERGASGTVDTLKAARAIAASEAYRKYSWVTGPITNALGDFRGMVLHANWAASYRILGDAIDHADKAAIFVALASNLVDSMPKIERIWESREPWYTKGAKLSAQVASMTLRASLGTVPAAADVIAFSLGGYLQVANLAGIQGAGKMNTWLKNETHRMDVTFKQYTDGDEIYTVINSTIGPKK